MHAGAVRVDGEKMSKSLGNFFTIRDVLAKYHPEVVRYLLVSSHYRSPINYSEDSLKEARGALERFYLALKGLPQDVAAAARQVLEQLLTTAGLPVPGSDPVDGSAGAGRHGAGGRDGQHTEHLPALLAELQGLARAHPAGRW